MADMDEDAIRRLFDEVLGRESGFHNFRLAESSRTTVATFPTEEDAIEAVERAMSVGIKNTSSSNYGKRMIIERARFNPQYHRVDKKEEWSQPAAAIWISDDEAKAFNPTGWSLYEYHDTRYGMLREREEWETFSPPYARRDAGKDGKEEVAGIGKDARMAHDK